MVDKNLTLTSDDIRQSYENALRLFYSGIKSQETRQSMEKNLKKFLVEACSEILSGTFEDRAQEFVNISREDQTKAINIILAYVRKLKDRTQLDRTDSNYLNPSTLPNKIKPIKKLLDMNGLGLSWKRVSSMYPEQDNNHYGRGYTRDELKKMLEHSALISTRFVILASSSGGFRLGAWSGIKWKHVFPVYKIEGQNGPYYRVELETDEEKKHATIVCAAMKIYAGSKEEYITLISIEAWETLQEYKKIWYSKMKKSPDYNDPLLLERYSKPKTMTHTAVKRIIERLVVRSGIRGPLLEGKRRHEVPATHGFRRYWDKVMMETKTRSGDTLSSLVIKERLMGHTGIVSTDKNYYWTNVLDMVPNYLEVMPELMVSEEYRIRDSLEQQAKRNEELQKQVNEKEEALKKMSELEAKVNRMQKHHILYR